MHSQEAAREADHADACTGSARPSSQAVSPNTSEVLDGNSDESYNDGNNKLPDLSKETSLSRSSSEIPEKRRLHHQSERTNANALSGFLWASTSRIGWKQIHLVGT